MDPSRKIRHLLLALVFLLHASFALAQSVRTCCADEACPVAQCAAMGCLPAAAPVAVGRTPQLATPFRAATSAPVSDGAPPLRVNDVWKPPD